jgi:hypothetical protein
MLSGCNWNLVSAVCKSSRQQLAGVLCAVIGLCTLGITLSQSQQLQASAVQIEAPTLDLEALRTARLVLSQDALSQALVDPNADVLLLRGKGLACTQGMRSRNGGPV